VDAGTDQTICFASGATLTANVTGTPGTVTWQPGNHSGLTYNLNPADIIVTTTYTAELAYGNGCFDSDEITVTVIPTVTLSGFSALPNSSDSICIGLPVTMKVTVNPDNSSLVWTQDGTVLTGITGDSVTFIPQAGEGSAQFTVTATNAGGCTAQESVTYNFKRCLAVPNAFTPNDDAVNDFFAPLLFGSNTVIATFQVYNRWGAKVFEATPDKQRWDGKHDGDNAPSDVYAYYIVLRYANGESETLKGDVTLLR
jgi:gliding motility-associated-like protein